MLGVRNVHSGIVQREDLLSYGLATVVQVIIIVGIYPFSVRCALIKLRMSPIRTRNFKCQYDASVADMVFWRSH